MGKIEDLKTYLFEQVEIEKKLKLEMFNINNDIVNINEEVLKIENAVKSEIGNVAVDGKKVFSNESLREAEFFIRTKDNVEYQAKLNSIKELKNTLKLKEIDLTTISHYISIGKIYLPLIVE